MKPNIMFVDDSIITLKCLQLLFKDEPYYTFTFVDPLEALNVTRTLDWAVVVTERYMNHMDGLEFLERVRVHSPHTIGIVMTGYEEIESNLEVLYPGRNYQFVKKPLDCHEIRQAVKEAIAKYESTLQKGL